MVNLSSIIDNCKIPFDRMEHYIELKDKRMNSINKKRKEIDKCISQMQDMYKNIDKEIDTFIKYKLKQKELDELNNLMNYIGKTIEIDINKTLQIMEEDNYIQIVDNKYVLTNKGHIATHIRETHCLIFAKVIESRMLCNLNATELIGVLSCFTNVSIQEEKRTTGFSMSHYCEAKDTVINIYDMYQNQHNKELQKQIDIGFDYNIHFDLFDYVIKWSECDNDIDCKQLIRQIAIEKDIFLGDFVKAILKINNIAFEMEKIAEILGDMEFLSKLKQVPLLTLKYVATNQSLYI